MRAELDENVEQIRQRFPIACALQAEILYLMEQQDGHRLAAWWTPGGAQVLAELEWLFLECGIRLWTRDVTEERAGKIRERLREIRARGTA